MKYKLFLFFAAILVASACAEDYELHCNGRIYAAANCADVDMSKCAQACENANNAAGKPCIWDVVQNKCVPSSADCPWDDPCLNSERYKKLHPAPEFSNAVIVVLVLAILAAIILIQRKKHS
jgi:hypothetical protein